MQIHTKLEFEAPHRCKTRETFKIDTGADGNLMQITMFAQLFPKIGLEMLGMTVESGITLFAYNNMPIKQFGKCSIRVNFKNKTANCKFFVVEHATVILGINDSEKLGLFRVNFDMIDKSSSAKLVHNLNSELESIKKEIETQFSDLFKGIGYMDGEVSIKLCDGVIPHIKTDQKSSTCNATTC